MTLSSKYKINHLIFDDLNIGDCYWWHYVYPFGKEYPIFALKKKNNNHSSSKEGEIITSNVCIFKPKGSGI